MSRTLALKTSSILICFIILAAAAFTVFAQESTTGATRKQTIQQKINIRQDKVDARIIALQEKQASKTAALKARLEKFKDQKKAEIAERVNTNLNKINQNQTNQMLRHINTMREILNKLEARNPTTTKDAIAPARSTIATVSAAVSAQSEKDYTIAVSSEARVRTDAKTQRDKLHKDLLVTRKMVIDAKQSVANAIRSTKSQLKEATTSGQQ